MDLSAVIPALDEAHKIQRDIEVAASFIVEMEWSCDLDTRLRPGAHASGILKEMFKLRSVFRKK